MFVSLQEADLSKVAWHPRGLVPIGSWVSMRLTELVVHDWDIRQPHETPARLAPTALPAMLTTLPEMHTQFLTQRLAGDLDGGTRTAGWRHGLGISYQGKNRHLIWRQLQQHMIPASVQTPNR